MTRAPHRPLAMLVAATAARFGLDREDLRSNRMSIDHQAARISLVRAATAAGAPPASIGISLNRPVGYVREVLQRFPVHVERGDALVRGGTPAEEVTKARRIMLDTATELGLEAAQLSDTARGPYRLNAARALAMARVRRATALSLPEIAQLFRRDTATVIYNIRRAEKLDLSPANLDRYWPDRPGASARGEGA